MKLFIDNVAILVIEHCLIDGLADIFSPDVVCGMSDDLLERLAAEPENIRGDRILLKTKLEVLQLGLRTCSHYSVPTSAGTVLPGRGHGHHVQGDFLSEPIPLSMPSVTVS
jgi:hypothetical protein